MKLYCRVIDINDITTPELKLSSRCGRFTGSAEADKACQKRGGTDKVCRGAVAISIILIAINKGHQVLC